MGKRGLAGSMIFTLFDRSALYQLINDSDRRWHYYAHEGEKATYDGNTNVWDWANEIDPTDGVQTQLKRAEYSDQVMPRNA